MKYKEFKSDKVLSERIANAEEKHFEATLRLKLAEKLKDDKEILAAQNDLKVIEETLSVLYDV